MAAKNDEDERLRSAALRNAQSVLHARRRAEEELHKQSEWLRVTLASIGDAVISTDADGRISFMNGVAEALTGWTQADALGLELPEVFHIVNEQTRRAVENPAKRALKEGTVVGLANHTVLIAKDKTERPIDDSAAPIRSEQGEIIGCVLVFRDVTDRHRADQALRESEAFSRSVLESSPDCFMVLDAAGRLLSANGLCLLDIDDFGPLKGLPVQDLWPEEARADVVAAIEAARAGGMGRFQRYWPTAKGTPKWWDVVVAPIRDTAGRVVRFISVMREITELKKVDQALRERESQLRLVTDNAPAMIVHCDVEGRYKFVNKPYAARFGLTPEQVIGKRIPEVVGAAAYATFEKYVKQALAGNAVEFETEVPYQNGGTHFIHAAYAPEHGPDGRVTGLIATIVNISDRKKAEENAGRLAAIIESSDDAIISKRLDGVITSWNHSAERMFGYTAAEAVGKHISLIIPRERLSEEVEVIARIRRGEKVDHFETERQAKDGHRLHISLTVSPIKDAAGFIIGASKVARDITQQKLAEADRESLLASERSARAEAERAGRLKEEFLATLSHELRTPLNAIMGWIQILRKKPPTNESLEQGLTVIDRNARMQAQLIADLLDMSRIISGKMRMDVQRVELPLVIEAALESIRPAAEAKEVRIERVIESITYPVIGDPNRLQQVVWNLLSNAVKFTPRGGLVQVTLARVQSQIEISVSDTGKGIKAEFLPHVFERFRQADSSAAREHGGLGLGLAIVKQLIELHGGTVDVASPGEGQGATFTIRIPVAATQAAPPGSPVTHPSASARSSSHAESPNLAGVHVLVVDDEPDARELIKRMLEDCGAEIMLAASADEALAAMERRQPDVILSDIGMPERDGYAFMNAVRRSGLKIPAAALTAFARSEDRTRALLAGYQTHITKPVEPAELLATVAALAHKTAAHKVQEGA